MFAAMSAASGSGEDGGASSTRGRFGTFCNSVIVFLAFSLLDQLRSEGRILASHPNEVLCFFFHQVLLHFLRVMDHRNYEDEAVVVLIQQPLK
jgi:hypothetical protein